MEITIYIYLRGTPLPYSNAWESIYPMIAGALTLEKHFRKASLLHQVSQVYHHIDRTWLSSIQQQWINLTLANNRNFSSLLSASKWRILWEYVYFHGKPTSNLTILPSYILLWLSDVSLTVSMISLPRLSLQEKTPVLWDALKSFSSIVSVLASASRNKSK